MNLYEVPQSRAISIARSIAKLAYEKGVQDGMNYVTTPEHQIDFDSWFEEQIKEK